MLVNNEIITELYENAGDTRYQKALEYVKDKRVTITNVNYENKNNFELAATCLLYTSYRCCLTIWL